MPLTTEQRDEITQQIADIDVVLNSGAGQVTVDGTTTTYNLTALERRRQFLQNQLDQDDSTNRRRPTFFKPRMG